MSPPALLLLLLLLLLLRLPRRPHLPFILSPVRTRQVADGILQEPLVGPLSLHSSPHKGGYTVILCALLQLLCICYNQRCEAARSCWAHGTLLLCCHSCSCPGRTWVAILLLCAV
jgi:hypothetical protein